MFDLFAFLGMLLGIIIFGAALLVIIVFVVHETWAAITAIISTNKENDPS